MTVQIIRCKDWGAFKPSGKIRVAGRPVRGIFHHTAGHVPQLAPGETLEEAKAYARAIQKFHMGVNGWMDSGHNFLVTRGGFVLEGRHGSVDAITLGRMVVSAHCPGQNDQPGVEIEHVHEPQMTLRQHQAVVGLYAWIFGRCGIRPTEIYGHSTYYATACPAELTDDIPAVRLAVAKAMTDADENAARLVVLRAWILARRLEGWSWDRLKATANWREFLRRGGK